MMASLSNLEDDKIHHSLLEASEILRLPTTAITLLQFTFNRTTGTRGHESKQFLH